MSLISSRSLLPEGQTPLHVLKEAQLGVLTCQQRLMGRLALFKQLKIISEFRRPVEIKNIARLAEVFFRHEPLSHPCNGK